MERDQKDIYLEFLRSDNFRIL